MARPNVNKLINGLAAQRKARLAAEAGDTAVATKPAAPVVTTPATSGTIDTKAARAAARAARYPAATAAEEARRAAHMADNTAAGAVVKAAQASSKATGAKAAKVAAAADKAEQRAAVARVKEASAVELLAKVADLSLDGSITARCWALFNAMGAPGTFERKVALEAALSHGINPASASLAFGRWQHTPDQPRSK